MFLLTESKHNIFIRTLYLRLTLKMFEWIFLSTILITIYIINETTFKFYYVFNFIAYNNSRVTEVINHKELPTDMINNIIIL